MGSDAVKTWVEGKVLARSESEHLPVRGALEGTVMDAAPIPGEYGSAVIEGVPFALTKIELRLGAVIFTCALMRPVPFAFDVRPGSPVKIYGVDGQLIADYAVPGTSGMSECHVRPGDTCTVFLPLRIGEINSASSGDRRTFDNEAIVY